MTPANEQQASQKTEAPAPSQKETKAPSQSRWSVVRQMLQDFRKNPNSFLRDMRSSFGRFPKFSSSSYLWKTLLLVVLYTFFSYWGPFRVLPWIGWWPLFWGSFILYLAFSKNWKMLVVFVITFVIFNWATGQDIFALWQVAAGNIREKVAFTNPLDYAKGLIYKEFGTWKNPDVQEKEPMKGVQFLSFGPLDMAYHEGDEVTMLAQVQVDGFFNEELQRYEPSLIAFSCFQEDKNGRKVPNSDGKILVDDEEQSVVQVPAQQRTLYSVSCVFPQGMKILSSTVPGVRGVFSGSEEGVTVGNKLVTKKRIIIEARTTFSQLTGVNLWTVVDKDKPARITDVRKDPTLTDDGFSKPFCKRGCGGPYKVSVNIGVQPVTEKKRPAFSVSLRKDETRFGSLASIEGLSVLFPGELGVQFDHRGTCDFDGSNQLSGKVLGQVNEQLERSVNITEASSGEQQSEEQRAVDLTFTCKYQVTNPLQRLAAKEIQLRTDYTAVIRKRGLVDIYKEVSEQPTKTEGLS